jgi:Ran GTPase-activating protein (RanGAP) involved in mRNA processing and transport
MAPHRMRLWSAGAKWLNQGHLTEDDFAEYAGGSEAAADSPEPTTAVPSISVADHGHENVRQELARRPHTADGPRPRGRHARPKSGYRRVFLGSIDPRESLADGQWADSRLVPELSLSLPLNSGWDGLSPAASPPSSYAGSMLSDDGKAGGGLETSRSTDSIASAVGFGLTIPRHADTLADAVANQPVGRNPPGDPRDGPFIRLATSAEHLADREFAAATREILGDDDDEASDEGGIAAASDASISDASRDSRSRPVSAAGDLRPSTSFQQSSRPTTAPAGGQRINESPSSDPALLYARRSQALCEVMGQEPDSRLQIAPRLPSERPSSGSGSGSGLDAALGARLDHLQSYLRESQAIREQFAARPDTVASSQRAAAAAPSMEDNDDAASIMSDTTTSSQVHGAPFNFIRRPPPKPPKPQGSFRWARGTGDALVWPAHARSEVSVATSAPEEPLVAVELVVIKRPGDGPDKREGWVEINFDIICHQLGTEFWGSDTDLGSCLDVLENKNSSSEQWWREREAKRLAEQDKRGPEYAALTAFRECDFAPVSIFFKMLSEKRTVVDLSHYHLGPQGAMAIARSVDSSKVIGTLVLADCGLLDEGVAAIASSLRRNNSVGILDLSCNPFGEPAVRELTEAMLINSSVVKLILRDCKLGCVEVEMLAKALYDNTTVRKLDLSSNEIGARGALALARMLEANNYIHHLHLDWNQVQLGGCRALATALTKNISLETLALAHNGLHNYGAIKLSEALITNCTLRTLDISSNSIGVEGCYAISHGMTRNQGLTALDLSGNTVGQDGGKRLWDSVLSHPALCALGLDHVGPQMIHNHKVFPLAMQVFTPDVCPAGHWALDLTCEWHRWLVKKMVERCTKDEFKKIESMQNMKLNGRPMSGGKKKKKKGPPIDVDDLPKRGLLRFDYMLERKEPAYERKCVFDLRSAKQAKIAKECYHRAVIMPHELWKDISISGQQRHFSKDGSMEFPKKGVLSFVYVIQMIDIDLENLDGAHQLSVEWPWHMYVAEQILLKILTDEGVVTDCKWEGMHYHLSKTQDNIPEVGLLELTYNSIIYRPQHEVYYQLNMACDTERWIAAQLRARADEDHSPVTAPERAGSFIQAVMYSESEPKAGEAAWQDWMAKWTKLPVRTSGVARGRTGEEDEVKLRKELTPDDGRPVVEPDTIRPERWSKTLNGDSVIDRGTEHYPLSMRAKWMYADKGRPSYKHDSFEYHLPKKGWMMVKFVVKSSRSIEAESHVVDLSNPEDRQKAIKLYSEATRSMYSCWTRIKMEKKVPTGVVMDKLEFPELMKMPGGWRMPHQGVLHFDHVLCRPVPEGCPDHIGIVRFHMLKQQVIRNINNGMPLQAVTDAMQYLNLAKVSAAKFSTEQLFSLLSLIPAARRNELVRLLYPSVTDYHNLFNLLLIEPIKKQCIPSQVGDIVEVETAHTYGGRRSRWQALSAFLAHGLQEYQRRPGSEVNRREEFHQHPRMLERDAAMRQRAEFEKQKEALEAEVEQMKEEEQRAVRFGGEALKVVDELQRKQSEAAVQIATLTLRMQPLTSKIELVPRATLMEPTTKDIKLMYQDEQKLHDGDQEKLDQQLQRTRRMSTDMGTRIELGGAGVAAVKKRDELATVRQAAGAAPPTPEPAPAPKKKGKGKGKGKGKKKKKARQPPPPNKLEVAAADTKKIVTVEKAAQERKVTPFVMKSTPAHMQLDEWGKARLLQRRQLGGASKVVKRQMGWGGFDKARPVGAAKAEMQEKYFLGPKMKGTKLPMQGEPVGAPSSAETPALMLRNEVARRQRVRARLAMLEKKKPS